MPLRTVHGLFVALMVIGLLAVWSGNSHAGTTYTYDELNRLKKVDYGNGTIIEYTYDGAGNRLTVQSPAPPTGTISIDSGAAATPSTNITLTLSYTGSQGCSQMQFSNDNITYSTPETCATTKTWILPPGEGTKTVYVKFRDAAGNWSVVAIDTIELNSKLRTQVFAGMHHSLSIKTDGTLWAWGFNAFGQLGDGTTNDKLSPVQIGTDTTWVSIAPGTCQTLALKSNGTLWGWGYNSEGELGDGTTVWRYSPVQIGTDTNWRILAGGGYHTLAIKADGTLWAWGYNGHGQVGDGTTANKLSPVQIGTDTTWASVAAGYYHSLALKSDGTLWAWGENGDGQLGDGTTVSKVFPVRVGTDNKWVAIRAGWDHSLALKSDGTMWAWGYNGMGQLGDGTIINRLSPVQIGTETAWAVLTGGSFHTLAVKANGTLWAWGDNYDGQLGDGTTEYRYSPVQIGTDTTWRATTAGFGHSLAVKSDGVLWAWGLNEAGQLGDGTTVSRTYPDTVDLDSTLPIKVGDTFYATLQMAYDAANNGDVIKCRELTLIQSLTVDRDISVTLAGGYDSSFTNNYGTMTNVRGMITTTAGGGTITIKNFTLLQW